MEIACERIRASLSIWDSGPSVVTTMTVGTIKQKDTAIIRDDRVFVIVLSKGTLSLSYPAMKKLLPRIWKSQTDYIEQSIVRSLPEVRMLEYFLADLIEQEEDVRGSQQ